LHKIEPKLSFDKPVNLTWYKYFFWVTWKAVSSMRLAPVRMRNTIERTLLYIFRCGSSDCIFNFVNPGVRRQPPGSESARRSGFASEIPENKQQNYWTSITLYKIGTKGPFKIYVTLFWLILSTHTRPPCVIWWHWRGFSPKSVTCKLNDPLIQAALVICSLFISDFVYMYFFVCDLNFAIW